MTIPLHFLGCFCKAVKLTGFGGGADDKKSIGGRASKCLYPHVSISVYTLYLRLKVLEWNSGKKKYWPKSLFSLSR